MKPQFAVLMGLIFLASVPPLTAQERASLTIDDAIQIGLQKSKGLHSSLMAVEYARAKSAEANARLFPMVQLVGAYTRLSDVPPAQVSLPVLAQPVTLSPSVMNNYSVKVTVQQPLFTGFRLQSNADLAEHTTEATEKDYDKARADLILDIRRAYWNLSQAIGLQSVVDENVERMQEHLRYVESLQRAGMVTPNEVLKVEVQLSESKLRQIDMRNNVQLARMSLNNLLGVSLHTEIEPATRVTHGQGKDEALSGLVQQAMERRPELKSMESRVKAASAAVSIARSTWFPQIYLTGNFYSSRPNQRLFPAQDVFKDTWDVGIAVSFDVWNWGTTVHQTDQARANLSRMDDGLAQLKDDIAMDVTSNYLTLLRAQERIAVADNGVAQAEENCRVLDARFKQGLSVIADVLDAEVALLQAKTSYTQSLVDFELAQAGLAHAIGE